MIVILLNRNQTLTHEHLYASIKFTFFGQNINTLDLAALNLKRHLFEYIYMHCLIKSD